MDDSNPAGSPQRRQWEDIVNEWLVMARRDDRDVVDDPPFSEARDFLENDNG